MLLLTAGGIGDARVCGTFEDVLTVDGALPERCPTFSVVVFGVDR